MKHVILFQNNCDACSKVAGMVRDLSVTGLEARPLEDPQIVELLSTAHVEIPDRPSLLIIDDDGLEIISGWAMRRRLANVVGWRRSGSIVRLLAAEWRARLARSAGSQVPSRRVVIGGALGGTVAVLAGWALRQPGSAAAPLRSGGGKLDVTTANPADVKALLATVPVQHSVSSWGPVGDVFKVSGEQNVFVLAHPRDEILTIVDSSPGAVQGGNPSTLSLGKSPVTTAAIRYYTVSGTPLADAATSNGRTTVSPVQGGPEGTRPDAPTPAQLALFIDCCGAYMTVDCAGGCDSCVAHPNAACIAACLRCAGLAAWTCAKYIF